MTINKHECGFDLSRFPGEWRVEPKQGAVIPLSCPLCGDPFEVRLQSEGVLARGTGEQTEFLRWKTPGTQVTGTSVAMGQFKLRFRELRTVDPHEICYPTIPAFVEDSGEQVVPALPVRREYFDCIDLVRLTKMWKAGERASVVAGQYKIRLPLRGHDELVELRLPIRHVFREVNLRIWPSWPANRQITDWKLYLVGLASAGPGAEALLAEDRVRLFARGQTSRDWGKPLDARQRGGETRVGVLDERPTWIGLEVTAPGGASDEAAQPLAGGFFFVPPAADRAAGDLRVGLDFGTSNTCVAVQGATISEEPTPMLVPKIDERDWNHYLVHGGAEARTHKGPDLWPSPTGFGTHADLFASELLFACSKVDQSRALASIDAWRYGIDFGLASAGAEPLFSEFDFALSDFKWQELLIGSAFARNLEAIQAHYLTAVLMNAYVRAVLGYRRGAAATVHVEWSYPISFNSDDLETLTKAMARAQDQLARLTGLDWTLAKGADESVAAAANSGDPGAKVAVYLDMGGGSTDVAVKIERRPGKWENVYLTSVRYAGMSLLAAYQGQQKSDSCLAGKTTLDVLRRRVREAPHVKAVLGDPTLFNKHQEAVTRNRTFHFYGYLTEYIARMLAAGFLDQRFTTEGALKLEFPRELKVAFYFLGNGWRFNDWLTGNDQAALGRDIWRRMMELLTAEQTAYAEQIRAALHGALMSHSVERPVGIPHDKASVAFGLLRKTQKATEPKAYTLGILGWETKVDGTRPIPWFAMSGSKDGAVPAPGQPPGGPETFGGAGPARGELETPWYDEFPSSPSLDWHDTAPRLPLKLEAPFELDPNLNMTRGPLKRGCMPVGQKTWLARGPYEVMLEDLFRTKLKTIGG